MKIIDISIRKETVSNGVAITCTVTTEDGKQIESVMPWHNPRGIWASEQDAREPAEIAAWLRSFAAAIERAADEAKAA
jgi:hypothetical protein